ncbi:MAG TPA: right-handed parallel beta-helix repeat-containing protein, partial [Spirochaetota bacterium]|nr:right-handed parallel beta-helix repeat-containing protein [Spirochaetota bacterium]
VSRPFISSGDEQSVMINNSGLKWGLAISNADNVTVAGITFKGTGDTGIRILDSSGSRIHNNRLYFSTNYAIYTERALTADIYSNRILNNGWGIYISAYSSNIDIYRNLIANSGWTGIYILYYSWSRIINNTIISNGASSSTAENNRDGVEFSGSGGGIVYNNIIAFNGNGNSIDYGLDDWSSAVVSNDYNIFYQNTAGGPYQNSIAGLNNTISTYPFIALGGNYELLSKSSPAYDNAVIITGINEQFYGNAPDAGWRELWLTTYTYSPRAGPNPFAAAAGDTVIKISGLTKTSTVEIFSVSGFSVRTFYCSESSVINEDGELDWDTTDSNGNKVAPGIYLFIINNNDGTNPVCLKITLLR